MLVCCLLILIVLAGCGAAPPLEESPAERAKLLTIPDEYKSRSNPLQPTADNLREAGIRYAEHCASCHSADGKGQTVLGKNLYPPAGDLGSPKTQKYTDGQLYWMISEGVRFSGMPAGRGLHTEDQIWKLVLQVRRFRRASSYDTAAEPGPVRLKPGQSRTLQATSPVTQFGKRR